MSASLAVRLGCLCCRRPDGEPRPSPAVRLSSSTSSSGKVLHAERATDPWFPASITKLMTTYVALDMVRWASCRWTSS